MFLVRRKVDGKWWRNLSYHSRFGKELWQDSPDGIVPFKTKGGCKNAMQGFLYERMASQVGWMKHPEWFDQKFEIVPVTVTTGGQWQTAQ